MDVPDSFFKDKDSLESFLRSNCKGAVFTANVTVRENEKGYKNNSIDKPWDNLSPSEVEEGDYEPTDDSVPF